MDLQPFKKKRLNNFWKFLVLATETLLQKDKYLKIKDLKTKKPQERDPNRGFLLFDQNTSYKVVGF